MAFNLNHEGQRTQGRWFLTILYLKCSHIREYTYPPKKYSLQIELFIQKNPVTVTVILSGHKSFKAGFFPFYDPS